MITLGNHLRFIRTFRGMTQADLGMAVGFRSNSADVRIAQYKKIYVYLIQKFLKPLQVHST